MSELAEWDSFCVIVGSAAGALVGLQFVVMTLIAERPPVGAAEAGAAFATPTIVHFGAALFLSALLRAPWHAITPTATLWGLAGLSGMVYAVIVIRRMRVQTAYQPDFEDWLFHVLLPMAAYAVLVLSALAAPSHAREALFGERLGRRGLPCDQAKYEERAALSRYHSPIFSVAHRYVIRPLVSQCSLLANPSVLSTEELTPPHNPNIFRSLKAIGSVTLSFGLVLQVRRT